jgi:hypothetical protein
MGITAGGKYLCLCDQKIHTKMCLILNIYGVMATWELITVEKDCWKSMGQTNKHVW